MQRELFLQGSIGPELLGCINLYILKIKTEDKTILTSKSELIVFKEGLPENQGLLELKNIFYRRLEAVAPLLSTVVKWTQISYSLAQNILKKKKISTCMQM